MADDHIHGVKTETGQAVWDSFQGPVFQGGVHVIYRKHYSLQKQGLSPGEGGIRRVSQLPADLLRVHIETLPLWCSLASPPVFST